MAKHMVAAVDEIPPGDRKIVDLQGRSIGIFNLDGAFFALRNRCPHQGGPLCLGPLSGFVASSGPGDYRYDRPGEIVRCPWHGWEFDLRTGQSWVDPRRLRVRCYDVLIEPGAEDAAAETPPPEVVPGPYLAETYPVSVKRRYIVVELPD